MPYLLSYSCCLSVFCGFCVIGDLIAESDILACSKEQLMLFFPEPIVKNVLIEEGHLSEKDAELISKELALKDKNMSELVEEKAATYHPNPFEDPSLRQEAIRIYQDTIFEVFSSVLNKYGLKDEKKTRMLLNEIRFLKSKMFVDCIRKQEISSSGS